MMKLKASFITRMDGINPMYFLPFTGLGRVKRHCVDCIILWSTVF